MFIGGVEVGIGEEVETLDVEGEKVLVGSVAVVRTVLVLIGKVVLLGKGVRLEVDEGSVGMIEVPVLVLVIVVGGGGGIDAAEVMVDSVEVGCIGIDPLPINKLEVVDVGSGAMIIEVLMVSLHTIAESYGQKRQQKKRLRIK